MGVFASDQHKPSVRYEGAKWADNGPSDLASLPWEGPYIIAEVLWPDAYKLKTIDDEVFTNA